MGATSRMNRRRASGRTNTRTSRGRIARPARTRRAKAGRKPGRAGAKRTSQRKGGRRGATQKKGGLSGLPSLGRHDGWGGMLVVFEHCGHERDYADGRCVQALSLTSRQSRGVAAKIRRATIHASQAFSAAGHVQRARIMAKLLEGPATYRALQRVTKLKSGPLYHHVNQLRLAGLILPKQRDLYELTRGGRNLVVAAGLLGPLVSDKRRRPISTGSAS